MSNVQSVKFEWTRVSDPVKLFKAYDAFAKASVDLDSEDETLYAFPFDEFVDTFRGIAKKDLPETAYERFGVTITVDDLEKPLDEETLRDFADSIVRARYKAQLPPDFAHLDPTYYAHLESNDVCSAEGEYFARKESLERYGFTFEGNTAHAPQNLRRGLSSEGIEVLGY